MRLNRVLFTLATLACCGTSPNLLAADAGIAKIVSGDVRVERTGESLPLRVGDTLLSKDRIVVPAKGGAGISLMDDTLISLGPNSVFVIDQFAFNAITREGLIDTSILRGAMQYVTGQIGRFAPQAVRVVTRTALIGIRGTEFIVEVPDEY